MRLLILASVLTVLAGAEFGGPNAGARYTPGSTLTKRLLHQGGETRPRTFHADIAPFIRAKCTPCHSAEGPGPFALETYQQVKNRATLIQTVLFQGKMPPAHAVSDFTRVRRYDKPTDHELLVLQEWIQQKMPTGSSQGVPYPWPGVPLPPDMTITVEDAPKIKAEGAPYSPIIDIPLPEKRSADPYRIRAFRIRPRAKGCWRRALLAISTKADEPKVFDPRGLRAEKLVGSWGIGGYDWQAPAGSAVSVAANESLQISPLLQPSGKSEDGGFELDLYFDKTARDTPRWITLGKTDFVIPAQDDFTTLTASTTLEEDVQLISVVPEARIFARMIRLEATLPVGGMKVPFFVYSWDSEWANSYVFEKPIALPKGSKLELQILYDNSGHSFGNERRIPTDVKSGPGPEDELFWMHLQVASPAR